MPSLGAMEGGQAELAPGLERPHLEGPGEGQRLVVPLPRRVAPRALPRRGDLRLGAKCPGLVAALAMVTRLLERPIGPHRGVVEMTGEERGFGQPGQPSSLPGDLARLLRLLHRLAQE